ncbi:MAG: hypothetical protein ABI622_02140 [Chloroflexota bacterium]
MTTTGETGRNPDAAARLVAAGHVAQLRLHSPGALAIRGADLGSALEQQLFFRLRDDELSPSRVGIVDEVRAWGRIAAIGGAGLAALARGGAPRGAVVALVRQQVHLDALARIETELRALGGPPLLAVRIGPAASAAQPAGPMGAPAIFEVMDPRLVAALAGHQLTVRAIRPSSNVPAGVAAFARRELPRIAAGAVGVESVVRRYRPCLLVSFDEVGTWARIIPAVARRAGIPTLDLPHAEAADAVAITGAGYDAFAVYGPRARAVMERAGIAAERIHEIGAPRFDPLVGNAPAPPLPGTRRAVVFAAQYVTGRMTAEVLAATYRAAQAAARATGSALLVVPHPAEPPGTMERLMAENPNPPALDVTMARTGLHAALAEAWVVLTGWSNSVMEAAIAGIPSITVNPGGVAPVDFAAEGLSTGVADEQAAAAAATGLRDAGHARQAVDRARSTLADRLGPLDGRASERAARLIRSLALGEDGAAGARG